MAKIDRKRKAGKVHDDSQHKSEPKQAKQAKQAKHAPGQVPFCVACFFVCRLFINIYKLTEFL